LKAFFASVAAHCTVSVTTALVAFCKRGGSTQAEILAAAAAAGLELLSQKVVLTGESGKEAGGGHSGSDTSTATVLELRRRPTRCRLHRDPSRRCAFP